MSAPLTTLGEADNGKTVELRVGTSLALQLYENASTGYRWAADVPDSKIISLHEDGYVRSSSATGSGGSMQWTIQAVGAGTAQLKLKLWRQWEGEGSVQRRYAVTLIVRP